MQEGGMNLSLNEADIKKKFSLKECKIVLHKVVNSENAIMWNSEIDNVSALEDPSIDKSKILRKRRRMASRINRFSRNRLRLGRRRQRKVTQLLLESINDENTTTSENSENTAMYNEIDWEENLECDTQLVDEFAPRIASSIIDKPSELPVVIKQQLIEDNPPSPLPSPSEPENLYSPFKEQEFATGLEIYVQIFDIDNWYAATVVEVDWDEDEVLVRYREGDPPPTDEWVKMSSQRLSRTKPDSKEKLVEKDIEHAYKTEEVKINEVIEPSGSDIVSVLAKNKEPEDTKETEKDLESDVISYFKPAMGRARKTLKRNKASLSQRISSTGNDKFVIGEDVLAKWSDHRMQKFPAKIKSILGDGKYDVLFYDGFEKTISEDQLYKTTPEEVAKYKRAKPSEADSFVDMDVDSKEARRQRKKKTFDDYVFAKDYRMTKRRVLKSSERMVLPKKISFYPKASESKELSDVEAKPLSRKRMRRRRRALFGPKRDNTKMKLHMLDMVRETYSSKSSTEVQDSENFYGFDSGQVEEDSTEMPETMNTDLLKHDDVKAEVPLEMKKLEDLTNLKPINITGTDGIARKSVVVPDDKLPDRWTKHAVLVTGNVWEIFLVSPDGYQIANEEEVKCYYGTLPDGGEPPPTLDFVANHDILPNLAFQQKELPVAGTPKLWFRRKLGGRGGRRGGRTHISAGPVKSIGRVRTLLPKYRLDQSSPLPSTPQFQPVPQPQLAQHPIPTAPERDIWRCPKEACDKKFRKESLLQMHIKHYHSELSSLVRSVPNMVDLACARSESNNSDWTPNSEVPKPPQTAVKRVLPRPFSSSPNRTDNTELDVPDTPLSSIQGPSRCIDRSLAESTPLKRQNAIEEKRTTIKTMLPIRQVETFKNNIDTDDAESEDEYIEQKKNGSRIFKPGKFRRGGKVPSDSFPEEEKASSSLDITEDGVVIERLKSEEFINCICGFREEDGLMIQCDICMCWQHGLCSNIENESEVPDRYVCSICRDPYRVRSSKKYLYAQHYLTQGKLPTFNFRSRNEDEISHREMILKRKFELTCSLFEIRNVDRSLAAKLNIAEKADHPKLYLWAKNWDEAESKISLKLMRDPHDVSCNNSSSDIAKNRTGPEPEAPIDLEECRIRLLDHAEHYYSQIEDRLTSLQTQIAALESLDADLHLSSTSSDKVIKQTIQMLLRDIANINKLAAIS